MKTSYKYLAIAFATLLCSCNEGIAPDMIESQVQISANITPCVLTRVTEDGTSFTDGDAIKVQNMDRENKNLATYTYTAATGKWNSADELYWDGEVANTFNAWYPTSAAYGSFTIPADQTSGIADSDWMTATASAKKADGTVNLSFNHNLAKVTVTIESWGNEYSANEKVANVLELRSLSSVMSYDGTLSGDEIAKWIKAYVAQANTSFSAIIAPGKYDSEEDIMQIYVNGSSTPLAVKTSSALTIESGKAYSFKLAVRKDLVAITSSVTVGEWDDVTLEDQQMTVETIKKIDYIDEYGINHGAGVEIDGVVWAPVNCGYHAADYPFGKLYQWGRKFGQGYDGDATTPTITRAPVSLEVGNDESNSNVFYIDPYYQNDGDWLISHNHTLWNSGTDDSPVKTEHDPCPLGWRVPTYNELDDLRQNRSSRITNNINQSGFWFSGTRLYNEDNPKVFLPCAGWRGGDNGNTYFRGGTGGYWSSLKVINSDYSSYYLDFTNTEAIMDLYYARATGYSVRCVQE